MTLVPFVCVWKKDMVEVYQRDDTHNVFHGFFNVVSKDICEKCGNPCRLIIEGDYHCLESYLHDQLKEVDGVFQLGHYYRKSSMSARKEKDILNECIWALKKDPDWAIPIAQSMFMAIKENFPMLLDVDAIVPVPNHPLDIHPDAKAVALSHRLQEQFKIHGKNVELIHALRKVKNISVRSLPRIGIENVVDGMFEFNNRSVANKNILLVDDVLTTGNIKGRCAKILKSNGAKKIWVIVAGRTV